MDIDSALKTSTGWVAIGGLVGYLRFREANFLVGTGRYAWHQSTCWGYILEAKEE